MDYKGMVMKHEAAQSIVRNYSNFEQKSISRVSSIENDFKHVAERYSIEIEKAKTDIGTYFNLMKEGNETLKKSADNVDTSMKSIAVNVVNAVKMEINKEIIQMKERIDNCDNTMLNVTNVIDYNTKVCKEKLNSIEGWIKQVATVNTNLPKFGWIDSELKSIETIASRNTALEHMTQ